MWTDTHAHLYLEQYKDDRSQMIERALLAKISGIYLPDIDSRTSAALWTMVDEYPGLCYGMAGLHPCSVNDSVEIELEHVFKTLQEGRPVAVGEVGLDYYWDKTYIDLQQKAFRRQIEWARDMDLPIIIHSRESLEDTISTIEEMNKGDLRGIFHCFNGTVEQARRVMGTGFLLGLGGVITFRNVDLDEVIKTVDRNGFVLETDAPYLSPVPFRGKRNESSYIPYIGNYISEVLQVASTEIAEWTSATAAKLFHPPVTKDGL